MIEEKKNVEDGEWLSQVIEIGYYRTMGIIIRTQDFDIECIRKQMPSHIANMCDFAAVAQKKKVGESLVIDLPTIKA